MNKSEITIKALASLIFAFTLCSTAQAQNRVFVSGAGDDLNPCTRLSPCRNFQRGHDAVLAGGEVVALDSAGYGQLTITKSVSITGDGVYAGITASSGSGITIATAGVTVSLRSLTIEGMGTGTNGISFTSGAVLHVENCVISGFTERGIKVTLAADGSYIFVKDTILKKNFQGIFITTTTGTAKASIDNCRFEHNGRGVFAYNNSRVTINRSVASGNDSDGFLVESVGAGTTAELTCEECVSSKNFAGFDVNGALGGVATIRVAHSTATYNYEGFRQTNAGVFKSLGNNLADGNNSMDTTGTITVITAR